MSGPQDSEFTDRVWSGHIIKNFVDKLSYEGEPTTRQQALEMTRDMGSRCALNLIGVPVLEEHGVHGGASSKPVGKIVRASMGEGDISVDLRIFKSPDGQDIERRILEGELGQLSLCHNRDTMMPKEVSLVKRGARPSTFINQARLISASSTLEEVADAVNQGAIKFIHMTASLDTGVESKKDGAVYPKSVAASTHEAAMTSNAEPVPAARAADPAETTDPASGTDSNPRSAKRTKRSKSPDEEGTKGDSKAGEGKAEAGEEEEDEDEKSVVDQAVDIMTQKWAKQQGRLSNQERHTIVDAFTKLREDNTALSDAVEELKARPMAPQSTAQEENITKRFIESFVPLMRNIVPDTHQQSAAILNRLQTEGFKQGLSNAMDQLNPVLIAASAYMDARQEHQAMSLQSKLRALRFRPTGSCAREVAVGAKRARAPAQPAEVAASSRFNDDDREAMPPPPSKRRKSDLPSLDALIRNHSPSDLGWGPRRRMGPN